MKDNGQSFLSVTEFAAFFEEKREHVHSEVSHLHVAQAEFQGDFVHPEGSRRLTTRHEIEFHMCDSGFYVYAIKPFGTSTVVDLWYAPDAQGLYLRDVEALVRIYEGNLKMAL